MMSFTTIGLTRADHGLATVTLKRPDVRNAFNAELVRELKQVFDALSKEDDLRAVFIRGEGKCFCAGADLNWMKASVTLSFAENEADARKMAETFAAIAACPVPVIAVVHGHALGGGAGLMAAADIALAADEVKIGFTEVLLGIIPAVISPFVLRKIGQTHARRYFCSGEIFDGREAARIGLARSRCLWLSLKPKSKFLAQVC